MGEMTAAGISRFFVRKKIKSKKVVIVASNGYSGLLSSATCNSRISQVIGETFTPLEVDGRQIGKLPTELKSFIHYKKGLSPSGISSPAEATKVTYLNGIFLFSHLLKAGFEPVVVNDFIDDKDVLSSALEGGLLAAAISTTFLPFREHVQPIIEFIRAKRKDVPIILGGPMVYLSSSLYLEPDPTYDVETLKGLYLFHEPIKGIDYYIVDRRGERTLLRLLHALLEGREPGHLKNLAIQKGGRVHFNPVEPEKGELSDESIDWDSVPDNILRHTVSVRASTGCPFKCEFCNFHFYSSELLYRPLSDVTKELAQLAKRREVKHVSFVDDNFLISPEKVETFSKMLADRNFPYTWSSFIRADSITDKNIGIVADSGANLLMFGIESGDAGVLSNMNKRSNTDHVLEIINGLGERGISTNSTIIVGFPGETHETVQHTIDLLNNYRSSGSSIHWYSPFLFILLPKTRVERHRGRYGLEGFMLNWRHNTMDVNEAVLEFKRLFLETAGAYFPYSTEHPFAAEVLGIAPEKAVKLIKLMDQHIKNQVLGKDSGDASFHERNKVIFSDIERILEPGSY